MDEICSEGLVHKIIWAAQDVTGASIEELMTAVGASFYDFLSKYEFNKVVRVLGRTFPEFLNGLDNLHEYLRFTFPKLKPPSFYCEHESRTGLTLHYRLVEFLARRKLTAHLPIRPRTRRRLKFRPRL